MILKDKTEETMKESEMKMRRVRERRKSEMKMRRVRERRKSEDGCKRMVMRSAWENRNAKKNVEFLSLLQLRVVVPRIEMWLLGGPEKDEGWSPSKIWRFVILKRLEIRREPELDADYFFQKGISAGTSSLKVAIIGCSQIIEVVVDRPRGIFEFPWTNRWRLTHMVSSQGDSPKRHPNCAASKHAQLIQKWRGHEN
jgi:hypothetical protein